MKICWISSLVKDLYNKRKSGLDEIVAMAFSTYISNSYILL